ncbi:NAD-dependent epimerase/dehydratase (plasmid) [Caballeronia cordobensis]|nr:NAD-dependent epimerase/dehydratase [Burkholderia sp. RPE67]
MAREQARVCHVSESVPVVNGDVFRWKWMWAHIAEYFGIEPAPFDGKIRPLEGRMDQDAKTWTEIAARNALAEQDIGKLVSWWHTDADIGRPMEVLTTCRKAASSGFSVIKARPRPLPICSNA